MIAAEFRHSTVNRYNLENIQIILMDCINNLPTTFYINSHMTVAYKPTPGGTL